MVLLPAFLLRYRSAEKRCGIFLDIPADAVEWGRTNDGRTS